jgi:hypothetical protein
MRFMVMVKSNEQSEDGEPPSSELLEAMARYNEELVKAGVLLDANGLTPSADGAIVQFTDGEPTVIDGPFTEAKELVAGYWIIDVKSLDEAVEWVKRVPSMPDDEDSEIEIRQVYEGEDFGEAYTGEVRELHERVARTIAERQS